MDSPISIRLRTPERDEILGDRARGLTYRITAPGGYAGGSLRLIGRWQDWALGPNAHVYAYDGRDCEVQWEGYADNPGQVQDLGGEAFEMTIQGAQTIASDLATPYLSIDSLHDNWRSDDRNDTKLADGATAESGAWPLAEDGEEGDEVPALMLQFPSGTPIPKGGEARMIHDLCEYAPMGIGAYAFRVKSGLDSSAYQLRISTSTDGVVETLAMQRAGQDAAGILGITMSNAADILKIRLRRTKGATTVGTDRVWAGFAQPYVVGNRLNLDGTRQIDAGTDLTFVKSQQVVRDVFRRMLQKVNPLMSLVENAGTFEIDQLCYADPVRATGILEDLELLEPDALWMIGKSDPSEYHEATYRAWGTEPRYEISTSDGYEAPGAEVDLCNRIVVGYAGPKGQKRSIEVTQYVAELGGRAPTKNLPGTPGVRVRDAEKIELDESVSSLANALRIGMQALALKNSPPKAATATVVRPVYDRLLGRMVAPYKMKPGYPAMVRENGDVLRLTELEANTETPAASLTLGTPAPTIEQMIARLSKTQRRRR